MHFLGFFKKAPWTTHRILSGSEPHTLRITTVQLTLTLLSTYLEYFGSTKKIFSIL